MMKIFQTKFIVVFGLLLCITPIIIFTPFMANALESNQPVQNLFPNNGTVYSKITDLEGALSDGPDEDTYMVNMEEGKEYSFRVEFNIAITGLFNLQISRPGEVSAFGWDNAFWTSGDAGVEKTLNFTVIADTTGEHALLVENGATGSAATYVLNFSRIGGGLDWWLYVVIGGGGLLVLIIIIVIFASMKGNKSKKKKTKKKSKKKK